MKGNMGSDTMSGGQGADRVNGGCVMDKIFGDAGGDNLNGGNANDTITGGPGNDTVFAADEELDSISCGLGEGDVAIVDQADLDAEGTNMQDFIHLTSCEEVDEPDLEEPPVETISSGRDDARLRARTKRGGRLHKSRPWTLAVWVRY